MCILYTHLRSVFKRGLCIKPCLFSLFLPPTWMLHTSCSESKCKCLCIRFFTKQSNPVSVWRQLKSARVKKKPKNTRLNYVFRRKTGDFFFFLLEHMQTSKKTQTVFKSYCIYGGYSCLCLFLLVFFLMR